MAKAKEAWYAFLIIVGIVALFYGVWWLFLRLDRTVMLSVHSKEWFREIKELEDYQVWDCDTHYRTEENCTYIDGKRQCTDRSIPYQVCGWETRTRTINSWPTSGRWPAPPEWAKGYTIGPGHYERRFERYIINLSDDKEIWIQTVWSEGVYDGFPVRGKCWVNLNFFRGILRVEKCKP